MTETAAHLADHVFPHLPVRQWVLSVPKRLRYFLQRDAQILSTALRIFLRVVQTDTGRWDFEGGGQHRAHYGHRSARRADIRHQVH